MSGHDSFGEYLVKIKKIASPRCVYCNFSIDKPEHLLNGIRWTIERDELEKGIGEKLMVDNVF